MVLWSHAHQQNVMVTGVRDECCPLVLEGYTQEHDKRGPPGAMYSKDLPAPLTYFLHLGHTSPNSTPAGDQAFSVGTFHIEATMGGGL